MTFSLRCRSLPEPRWNRSAVRLVRRKSNSRLFPRRQPELMCRFQTPFQRRHPCRANAERLFPLAALLLFGSVFATSVEGHRVFLFVLFVPRGGSFFLGDKLFLSADPEVDKVAGGID